MLFRMVLLLMVLGAVTSAAAFVFKRAPVYSSMANLAIWLTVGYGATSIDFVDETGNVNEAVASEPTVAVLAFGNAALSAVVLIAAATGQFATDEEPTHPTDTTEMKL